jgi:hypothetical protein
MAKARNKVRNLNTPRRRDESESFLPAGLFCDHRRMQSQDDVHFHCPDCGFCWDEAAEGSD